MLRNAEEHLIVREMNGCGVDCLDVSVCICAKSYGLGNDNNTGSSGKTSCGLINEADKADKASVV